MAPGHQRTSGEPGLGFLTLSPESQGLLLQTMAPELLLHYCFNTNSGGLTR